MKYLFDDLAEKLNNCATGLFSLEKKITNLTSPENGTFNETELAAIKMQIEKIKSEAPLARAAQEIFHLAALFDSRKDS